MRKRIYNFLILFMINGFVTKSDIIFKNRRKKKVKACCYMNDLIDPTMKLTYGGDDESEIRLLTNGRSIAKHLNTQILKKLKHTSHIR